MIDAGSRAFDEAESFAGMVSSEIQTYLLLVGVDALLRSKGVEVPFEIDINTKRYK